MNSAAHAIQTNAPQASNTAINTMDTVHEPENSELHDSADSIDHLTVSNSKASDSVYQRWNALCEVHLVRFMQHLMPSIMDEWSKSEERLQYAFTAFLIRDLEVGQNAEFLSLWQEPHVSTEPPTQGASQTQEPDGSIPPSSIHEEIEMISLGVANIRKQLEKMEGASGALSKDRPIELLTITEPEVAKLTEMEKLFRSRLLAAYTLNQDLLDASEKFTFIDSNTGGLEFSSLHYQIRRYRRILKNYEEELETMSTSREFWGLSVKRSIFKKYLSEPGSPIRAKLKLLKLSIIKRWRPDKKTTENGKIKEKDDMAIRQSKYSEITRFVTDMLVEITKAIEKAEKQKATFLETGIRIASASILQSAAKAGYLKEDVFENGILVQRRFFKKGE